VHEIKVVEETIFEGTDKNGEVIKVELSFIFPKGSASVKEWYTVSSGNPKAVNVGVSKLNGSVMCDITEIDKDGNKYLRIDDDYGNNYKPVVESKAEVKEQETVSAKADTDEIPF